MKAVGTVIQLRREQRGRVKKMVPNHVWPRVEPHGLAPGENEQR